MSFMEIVESGNAISSSFDEILARCEAFAEASYNEYKVNLKEASLYVEKQNGTEEDLAYLENAASEGFIIRAKKAIEKIVKEVKEKVEEIIKKIQDFFAEQKTKDIFKKVEKAAKENPRLKSVKIKIPDHEKMKTVNGKYSSKIDRKISMMRANKFTSSDAEEIDKVEDAYSKEKKIAAGALITVSLAAAIALVNKWSKDAKADDMNVDINKDISAEDYHKHLKAVQFKAKLAKDGAQNTFNNIISAVKEIGSAITGKGAGLVETLDTEPTSESTSVQDEQKFEESQSIDAEAYVSELLRDIQESTDAETTVKEPEVPSESEADEQNAEEKTTEESKEEKAVEEETEKCLAKLEQEIAESEEVDKKEDIDVNQYLESMEAELFGNNNVVEESAESDQKLVSEEEYLESMEAELFGEDEVVEESVSKVDAAMAELESLLD